MTEYKRNKIKELLKNETDKQKLIMGIFKIYDPKGKDIEALIHITKEVLATR